MKSILALLSVCLIVAFVSASPPLPFPGDSEDHLSENCRTPKCPESKAAGDKPAVYNLPYPLDCLQYVECKGSVARVLACPPDQVFDKNTFTCAPKNKVHCVPCYQQAP